MRPKWNRKKVLYDRIQRALNESRKAFDDVVYPKLDITSLSVSKLQKLLLKKQDYKSDTVFCAWMIT